MPTTWLSVTIIASAIVTGAPVKNCHAPSSSWQTRQTGSCSLMTPTVVKAAVFLGSLKGHSVCTDMPVA